MNRGCPDHRVPAAIRFCCQTSIGWEVVQLVGHQTLTLGILVRVQASQPNSTKFALQADFAFDSSPQTSDLLAESEQIANLN